MCNTKFHVNARVSALSLEHSFKTVGLSTNSVLTICSGLGKLISHDPLFLPTNPTPAANHGSAPRDWHWPSGTLDIGGFNVVEVKGHFWQIGDVLYLRTWTNIWVQNHPTFGTEVSRISRKDNKNCSPLHAKLTTCQLLTAILGGLCASQLE